MQNKDILSVIIINEPFEYAELDILSRPLRSFAEKGIQGLQYEVCECLSSAKPMDTEYTALIYSYMPLVTSPFLISIAEALKKKSVDCINVGNGFICKTEIFDKAYSEKAVEDESAICARTPLRLSKVYKALVKRNIERAIQLGALIIDDTSVIIEEGVIIEAGAIIQSNVNIKEGSVIRSGAVIESGSVIDNSIIGSGTIISASRVYDSKVGDNTTVGPWAYLRGGAEIGNNCRIGDFVEVKASKLGNGTKSAHLTYIGDADIGENVNIGCGTVFANYNGKLKQKTIVGDNCFIGSNTNLVAPLTIGHSSYTAAGSTITKDIPPEHLVIARSREVLKERKEKK